jgi:hypothetical protein
MDGRGFLAVSDTCLNFNDWTLARFTSAMNDLAAACFDRESKLQPEHARSS